MTLLPHFITTREDQQMFIIHTYQGKGALFSARFLFVHDFYFIVIKAILILICNIHN